MGICRHNRCRQQRRRCHGQEQPGKVFFHSASIDVIGDSLGGNPGVTARQL
jgi:hypothetical protein